MAFQDKRIFKYKNKLQLDFKLNEIVSFCFKLNCLFKLDVNKHQDVIDLINKSIVSFGNT